MANSPPPGMRWQSHCRATGCAEDAAAVKALPKPLLSVWTVNQLYWRHRKAFEQLIAAGERLRTAQASQLAGNGGEMHAPFDALRAALAELTPRATALLRDAGHAPTPALTRRITTTLEALANLWRRVIRASRRPPNTRRGPARLRRPRHAGTTQGRPSARRRAEPRHSLPSTDRAEPPEEAGYCREEATAPGRAPGAALSGSRGAAQRRAHATRNSQGCGTSRISAQESGRPCQGRREREGCVGEAL